MCKYYLLNSDCPFSELVFICLFSVHSHMESNSYATKTSSPLNIKQRSAVNLVLKATALTETAANLYILKQTII